MKNIIFLHARADGFLLPDGTFIPETIVRTVIIILLFYIASSFLLALVRTLLNHQLKNRMIRMGLSVDEAEKMLQIGAEGKDYAVKWFLLLICTGIGCTVISFFPFSWLSAGVLLFCVAMGFAGYYWYLKKRTL